MNKMFLLGLSLFCLLRGGEPKLGKKVKEVVCATCQKYRKGFCLEREGTCVTKVKKGCRSQSVYEYSQEVKGWAYTYAKMECVDTCGERVIFMAWYRLVNICCSEKNRCNIKNALA
ncbi:prostate and testis expressed protein 2-like [Trichosurus vulpecula]|uniref:prostate and testis expressed protein 2-like n=1 Tax=Trichosurus vulpecula TaxID=9337 RepID=UPI00186B366C|nr:prostate and testis expressed protein 2-like [Trichosurus vulpecula]